jgi:regulator of protease activity HflC (stomatin/prohibitin superfamily)
MGSTQLTIVLCLAGGAVVLAIILLASAIRVVPEYMRLVVFRLGRCVGSKGPGIVFLIPVVDRTGARDSAPDFDHQG